MWSSERLQAPKRAGGVGNSYCSTMQYRSGTLRMLGGGRALALHLCFIGKLHLGLCAQGELAPVGAPGELLVSGPRLALGYKVGGSLPKPGGHGRGRC